MIPPRIIQYLQQHNIPYTRRYHARAVSAQELAAELHASGFRVAKSVLLEADEKRWIAVLPAAELVDEGRLAQALGARKLRLLTEAEFAHYFPDCELGAEPPFGRLYDLPVVVDARLAQEELIVLRAGSHQESIEMRYSDFAALEQPAVVEFGRLPPSPQTRRPAVVHV